VLDTRREKFAAFNAMMTQSLFQRLIPDVRVESVRVVNARDQGYYLFVQPDHQAYWVQFRHEHRELITLACRRYNASRRAKDGRLYLCPVFASKEDLFSWLADIFRLTQGEKNLLRLWMI